MPKIKAINKSGEEIPVNIIFAFTCSKNSKTYVALDFKKSIFEQNSSYNNLDIMEITKQNEKYILLSEIKNEDWDDVKHSLQYEIFSNIKNKNNIF